MHTVDRFGQRIDEVDFHPSWHWLMRNGIGFGLGATAWTSNTDQAHLRRAASYIAWGQVEQGHMCPITMTYAVVPALRADDAIKSSGSTSSPPPDTTSRSEERRVGKEGRARGRAGDERQKSRKRCTSVVHV